MAGTEGVGARMLGGLRCAGCELGGTALCEGCRRTMRAPARDRRGIPHIDRIVCPWSYEGAARALVLDLKVRGRRAAAVPLVDQLVRSGRAAVDGIAAITWVPGRVADVKLRGFDHGDLLAHGVALGLGLPRAQILVRAVDTPDQAGLSGPARRRNLAGAFIARPHGGHVVLVDDVVTTGTTASTCAQALKRRGVSRVTLLAVCRA